MITIEISDAIKMMEQAVEERGKDYVYEPPGGESCEYTHVINDQIVPGCIVGQGFYDKGIPLERIHNLGGGSAFNFIKELERNGLANVSENAGIFLRKIQVEQDQGMAWGNALDFALSGMRDYLFNEEYPAVRGPKYYHPEDLKV